MNLTLHIKETMLDSPSCLYSRVPPLVNMRYLLRRVGAGVFVDLLLCSSVRSHKPALLTNNRMCLLLFKRGFCGGYRVWRENNRVPSFADAPEPCATSAAGRSNAPVMGNESTVVRAPGDLHTGTKTMAKYFTTRPSDFQQRSDLHLWNTKATEYCEAKEQVGTKVPLY